MSEPSRADTAPGGPHHADASPPASAQQGPPAVGAVPPGPLPWVLLRGLTRERRHWGAFPAQLAAAAGEARLAQRPIVALDLPGNGARHGDPSPASVPVLAADARRALRQLGHAPPYRVLAMSLGAMVAVAWAEAWPQEVAGLVLVNTSLRPFSPLHRRLRPAAWPLLLRALFGGLTGRAREAAILELTSHRALTGPTAASTAGPSGPALAEDLFAASGFDPAAVLDDWTAWQREHPVTRANALRQLIAAARYRAPRAAPACPTLVLAGARDRLVDPGCSRALAQAWGLGLVEHPAAGHDLALDAGDWLAQQAASWAVASPGASRPLAR